MWDIKSEDHSKVKKLIVLYIEDHWKDFKVWKAERCQLYNDYDIDVAEWVSILQSINQMISFDREVKDSEEDDEPYFKKEEAYKFNEII